MPNRTETGCGSHYRMTVRSPARTCANAQDQLRKVLRQCVRYLASVRFGISDRFFCFNFTT